MSLTDSSGTHKFFYDGEDVIQEYDSDWSTVTKEYTHGPWVDEPLSMTVHGQQNDQNDQSGQSEQSEANSTYYLMKDRLGSIINILDENEALKTTYSYDAFGEPTATYHSGQVDCTYRFTGREYDSGMGNYFSRARYYNQSLGRFFSRDPIMSLSSLYAYCNNSPANFTDPSGMEAGMLGASVISGALFASSISVDGGTIGTPCGRHGRFPFTGPEWWCRSADPDADDNDDGIKNRDDPKWLDADEDGDGATNGAELAAGSDIGDGKKTPWDLDGDGYTNWFEEQKGTDPNDPNSNPGETNLWAGLGVILTVAGIAVAVFCSPEVGVGVAIAGAYCAAGAGGGGQDDWKGSDDPKDTMFDPHSPRYP